MKKENKINKLEDSNLSDGLLDDDLLLALAEYAHPPVPTDFVLETTRQFELAVRRRWIAVWTTGIIAALLTAAPIIWLIILNIKQVAKLFAGFISVTKITVETIVTMWSQVPEISTVILLGLWVALFGCAVVLIKAFKSAVPEHSVTG